VDAAVNTTIINGKVIMHDKIIGTVDEPQIAANSQQIAEKVWRRFHESQP
jgi:hypothetical protein